MSVIRYLCVSTALMIEFISKELEPIIYLNKPFLNYQTTCVVQFG